VLHALQRRLTYFPDRTTPAPPDGVREVGLSTSDGLRLTAWRVEPSTKDGSAVLVAPGNGGNRAGRLPLARQLAGEGRTVLLLDYRGYGGNPGTPSEAGLARDARAAWDHLTTDFDRIVLFGESLGAAVVARLATEVAPLGVVLRSPFESLVAVGRAHYPFLPVGALLRDRYPVAGLVARVAAPTVVVYGTRDAVVPPAQSRAVAGAAANLVDAIVVDGADHNDAVLGSGGVLVDAVRRLV
jgi:pimeloyl-ACP methyl ester carboxylesterase